MGNKELLLTANEGGEDSTIYRLRKEVAGQETDKKLTALTRGLNLTAIYLGTPATMDEIGDVYSISKERVSQIIEKTLLRIYKEMPVETRKNFSKSDTKPRKSIDSNTTYHRIMKNNENARNFNELLEEGLSVREAYQELELSPQELSGVRDSLKRAGIEVPKLQRNLKEYFTRLRNAKEDEEVRDILNEVDESIYFALKKQEDNILISVLKIAREAGVNKTGRNMEGIIKLLEENNIPYAKFSRIVKSGFQKGKQTYFLIHRNHEERVKEIIGENRDNLIQSNKMKIEQFTGPLCDQLPSVYEIQQKKGMIDLKSVCAKEEVRISGKGAINIDRLLKSDCTVAVFRCWNGKNFLWAIYDEDEEKFREYLRTTKLNK